jgi:hypothetical protein
VRLIFNDGEDRVTSAKFFGAFSKVEFIFFRFVGYFNRGLFHKIFDRRSATFGLTNFDLSKANIFYFASSFTHFLM